MRRVQLRHARRFNRTHRRDGPLMRGRFLSKRVRSNAYGCNVVRYTHENPVFARLCRRPADYRWSSAWLCTQPRLPRWFCPDAIDRFGLWQGMESTGDSRRVMRARADFVEARLHAREIETDRRLDEATPGRVLDWMSCNALLADGAVSSPPLVGPTTLVELVGNAAGASWGVRTAVPGAGTYETRELLTIGLLRDVASSSYRDIAAALETGVTRVRRLYRLHRRCLKQLHVYAECCESVIAKCLELIEEE